MSLKLTYYGQNDSVNATPAVTLTGDPGTDQAALTAAGYLGGKIMAIVASAPSGYTFQNANEPAFGAIGNIVPCDIQTMVPYATLLNGPGEFAGAIGPSGSKKAPVVRGMWQGMVNFEAYDPALGFTLGAYVYCGGTGASPVTTGLYTATSHGAAVGICTHVPTTPEPWLGVASLL